jgi:hypothetical protein
MSIGNLSEFDIIQVNLALLSNVSDANNEISNDIELDDKEITWEKFITYFYNNTEHYFEINPQFRNEDDLLLTRASKKNHNFSFNKNNSFNIVDSIKKKYIEQNLKNVPSNNHIKYFKDITNFKSLTDFKYYQSSFHLEDIYNFFQNYYNNVNKKFFRFKFFCNYNSNELGVDYYFTYNLLVKIPSEFISNVEKINKNVTYNIEEKVVEEKVVEEKVVEEKVVEEKTNLVYSKYLESNKPVVSNIEDSNDYEEEYNFYDYESEVASEVASVVESVVESEVASTIMTMSDDGTIYN